MHGLHENGVALSLEAKLQKIKLFLNQPVVIDSPTSWSDPRTIAWGHGMG